MVGNNKNNQNLVHLIDFGLSRRFRNENSGEHIPYKDNRGFIGNSRFASIYTHLGIEQSRRDDLISLSYIIFYFYKGFLPWQGIKCKTLEEKNQKVFEKKIALKPEEIFQGTPSITSLILAELLEFYSYCSNLHFDEKPDYKFLKRLIRNIGDKNNFVNDNLFDWTLSQSENFKVQSDFPSDFGSDSSKEDLSQEISIRIN